MFCNLISNAVKFSPPGSLVRTTTADRGDSIEIVVSDGGIGIAPENLPVVFDSFQQGGKQITKTFGGLGLGLAISKGIIEEHAGRIFAASDGPNLGSRFTVVLPTCRQRQKPSEPVAVKAPLEHHRGLQILLVEDHDDTARMMSRLLQKIGHQVVTAPSLAAAVDAGRARRFDLLMSDLGLPDGSGLELVELLGDRCPPNGIALTGFGMEDDIVKTRDAGFQHHLTKPVNFDDLKKVIGEIAVS